MLSHTCINLSQNLPASNMDHSCIKPILTTLVDQLQDLYQDRVSQIILFGSQARGEATIDSDIDILIVLNDEIHPSNELQYTSSLIAQICLDYGVLISRIFMSVSRFESEQSPLLKNIRREGVIL